MPGRLTSPDVVAAVAASADPPRVRVTLARFEESHPKAAARLLEDPWRRNAFIALAAVSRSLTGAVLADPTLLEPITEGPELKRELGPVELRAAATVAITESGEGAPDELDRLRRFKRRQLLRIAVRDLLGLAELVTVGRELAALAEACLEAALRLSRPGVPMAVAAMGKLGGRELNYASDVDVLFVHEGDVVEALRAARAVLSIMARPTPEGIVFRTDAGLRPEGRAGPLSRSIEAYAAYYDGWAQAWERQALIKARPIAGEEDLGLRFYELTRSYAWSERLDPDAVREIRQMKARAEQQLRRRSAGGSELKRGPGGIRDVEFSVQLLQLVHGRQDPSIRSPNTLEALGQLSRAGYVHPSDTHSLETAYRFLRTVEHRLQLEDESQVHFLPSDPTERARVARVLGYRDSPVASALDRFEAERRKHQGSVRSIHEKLFFRPLLEALAGSGPLSLQAAVERLAAFGFRDASQTRAALGELTTGLNRQSRLMAQLFPLLLGWLSETPDPDLGLLQMRLLAEGPARSLALSIAFRDTPGAAERVCRLLGSSRVVGSALRRHPEFLATLGDSNALRAAKRREDLLDEALETLAWRGDAEARREGLRRFKRRELLRIAARDLLGLGDLESTGEELSALAEATLDAAVRWCDPPVRFAIIGMGNLGGKEMSYASDVDVLFVYEGGGEGDFDAATRCATDVVRELGATTPEGRTFVVDANLRPEGRQGALARSLAAYQTYYERWALTWEFQALLKARPVAGDRDLGARFCSLVQDLVFDGPFPPERSREVRRMKARIERERIPPGEDPQFHLKLGRGSLSDVEFTVQLLQLENGGSHPQVRTPSTLDALGRLTAASLLAAPDAADLEAAYRLCARARNASYLLTGASGDALPAETEQGTRLARLLGYGERPLAALRHDYRRATRRARRVVERVFYGLD